MAVSRFLERFVARLRARDMAGWLAGAGWVLASSLVERGVALVQTILIARAVGIEDYGRYALFFATVGAMVPLANLQLGYAVNVHLAQRRSVNGHSAGALLAFAEFVTNVSVVVALVASLLFAGPVASYIFGSADHWLLVIAGGVLLLLSTKVGLSDGVLQAYERFRLLAMARVVTALATLVLLGMTIRNGGGLVQIIVALVACALLRLLMVARPAREIGAPLKAGVGHDAMMAETPVLVSFCLPSVLVSLAGGYASWVGLHALSQNGAGLSDVAIVNTAMQWRLPVLMITASLATSLLPRLANALQRGDRRQASMLSLANLGVNVGVAVLASGVVALFAPAILSFYGASFVASADLFVLFLLPVILIAYTTSLQQNMVAAGRMWLQTWSVVPNLVINVVGVWHFGATLTGERLGYIQLVGLVVTALLSTATGLIFQREEARS